MNTKLLSHNLKSAWRSLMKYKVQNTISVLCLSVGIVLFCVTVGMSYLYISSYFKSKNEYSLRFYPKEESLPSITDGELHRMIEAKTPSVEYFLFASRSTDYVEIKDDKDKVYGYECSANRVSPDHFRCSKIFSAITGKRVENVKPGEIYISEYLCNTLFGNDVNPLGYTLSFAQSKLYQDGTFTSGDVKEYRIKDVVREEDNVIGIHSVMSDVMLIEDGSVHPDYRTLYEYKVVLKDGATMAQLQTEMDNLYPSYSVILVKEQMPLEAFFFMLVMMIVLGSSVLIIGLSGFLKMQIQLFWLRTKELALRRCNGAKPKQIFMLLCSEIFITFAFVTLFISSFSIVLSCIMTEYIDIFEFTEMIVYTVLLVAVVCILVYLVAVFIAWFAVRRVVSKPLGMTAGRSVSTKGSKQGLILGIQYFMSYFLLAAVLLMFLLMRDKVSRAMEYAGDLDKSRQTVIVTDEPMVGILMNEKESQALVKQSCKYNCSHSDTFIRSIYNLDPNNYNEGDTLYDCRQVNVDCSFFDITGITLKSDYTQNEVDHHTVMPVYCKWNEAKKIARELGVKSYSGRRLRYSLDGEDVVLLGYAPCDQHIIDYQSDFYYVYADPIQCVWSGSQVELFVAKEGKVDDLKSVIADKLHQVYVYYPESYEFKVSTIYEKYVTELEVFRVLYLFGMVLTFFSLLSIILTMYSSVSLETRGRQKEVAIRKIHGAKARNIIMIFARSYVMTMIVSFVIALVFGLFILACVSMYNNDKLLSMPETYMAILCSFSLIAVITFLTIWQKIHRVANINAADMVKRE